MLKVTPRNNLIEFTLEVTNAKPEETQARLVVEVAGEASIITLDAPIQNRYKGSIPLKEAWDGKRGKVKLEVIARDTMFVPYEKDVVFDVPFAESNPIQQMAQRQETRVPTRVKSAFALQEEINDFFKTNK